MDRFLCVCSKSTTATENNCFVILPSAQSEENTEARPRPGSLRQNPRRRFSVYIPSTSEFVAPSQPPISIRLKRINNNQPPNIGLISSPPNGCRVVENPNLSENRTKSFLYVCVICSLSCDTFEEIYAHCHKAHEFEEFSFGVTERVRCVFCEDDVTFYSIREHMSTMHPMKMYAFAKYTSRMAEPLLCGICSKKCECIEDLQKHFRFEHPSGHRPKAIEPMPTIDDQTLDTLTQHSHCNGINIPTNSSVKQYKCFICNETNAKRLELVKHIRTHLQQVYQCLFCVTKTTELNEIRKHHRQVHNSQSTEYRVTNARDNLHSYYQIKIKFANGLQMILGDVLKTRYGQVEELIEAVNELNGFGNHSRHTGYSIDIQKLQRNGARKIGDRRRQTML